MNGDSKAEAALRQHWINIAGGFEASFWDEEATLAAAKSGKPSGVGFSVSAGTRSCWEGGNVPPGCARIDLSALPFGADGNLELSRIDPALLAKRYKGGNLDNQGWPQGFFGELFNNNYLALKRAWEAGDLDPERRFSGEPTWQEMYDAAFSLPRTSNFYRTWLVDRNPEISTDPAKPILVKMKSPYRYNWSEHTTFKSVTTYTENARWLPGNGPLYQPGYPEVFGKDPNAPPATPPLPPPVVPVVPPPAPPAVPPAAGTLSAPEQRIKELREHVTLLALADSRWSAWVTPIVSTRAWPHAKPFLVEALKTYRLFRRHLGDTREIPK